MPLRQPYLFNVICAVTLSITAPVTAQDVTKQAPLSELYEEADAQTAYENLDARWDAAYEQLSIDLINNPDGRDTYVPKYPVLQQVTWPYEACTDVVSLVPPPLEGWAIESRTSWSNNPVGPDQAVVNYVAYDGNLQPHEDGFWTADRAVQIMAPAVRQSFRVVR